MNTKAALDPQLFKRRHFGRRMTRPAAEDRQAVFDNFYPTMQIAENLVQGGGTLRITDLFKAPLPPAIWFEIGFGSGEHLAELIRRDSQNGYIGAEPFITGMINLINDLHEKPPAQCHARLWMSDAIPLAASLEDECIDGIYVLNPDPWPKKRHYKRRIISQENLDIFARILKPGGKLIMATDMDDLAEWMVTQTSIHPAFAWTAECAQDWQNMPTDWIQTRYEKKGALKGRQQSYLIFKRL